MLREAVVVTSCPEENVLVRFARGGAGEHELGPLETHLDGCDSCRRAVAAAASEHTLPTMAPAQELRPGTRVGRYEIERELGRGGMGVVYQARDVTLDRRVALKLLHARRDAESQTRLLREAQVMAKLAHPNVVPVFELGEWAGDLYLVMELVNGLTLDAWLKGAKHSRKAVLDAFLEAGRGLAAAHAAGVVHRDFKPANVLMGVDGRVRVTDFGLSRPGAAVALPPVASPLVTREGALVGTVAYMAPEQLDGAPADEQSDQFSFCVALTEALTGSRPFEGDSWSTLATSMAAAPKLGSISRRVRLVLRRGLSRQKSMRYTSMSGLLNALERSQRTSLRLVGAVFLLVCLAGILGAQESKQRRPTLEVPSAAAVPKAAVVKPLSLEAREIVVLEYKEVIGFSIGDARVVAAKIRDEGADSRLMLIGMAPGRTTVEVKTAAQVELLDVTVGPRTKPEIAEDPLVVSEDGLAPVEKQITLFEGDERTLLVMGIQRVAVGDPGVLDVTTKTGDRVVLHGVNPGTTSLIIGTKERKWTWEVNVRERAQSDVDTDTPTGVRSDVQAVMGAHMKEIARCYEAQLPGSPRLEGRAVIAFRVEPTGRVKDVELKSSETKAGNLSAVISCVMTRLKTWDFPKTVAGYQVSGYPIMFQTPVAAAPGESGEVKESLRTSDIMEGVLASKSALAKCSVEQHEREPGVTGKLLMKWTIETNGSTSNVSVVSGEHERTYMAGCVGGVIKSMTFAKARKQAEPVTFPFKF